MIRLKMKQRENREFKPMKIKPAEVDFLKEAIKIAENKESKKVR